MQIDTTRLASPTPDGFGDRVTRLITRLVHDRIGVQAPDAGAGSLILTLAVSDGDGDGYEIAGDARAVTITGDSARALLFGVGRFLHTSGYENGVFTPSMWRGREEPESPLRILYLASHFHNYYQNAPIDSLIDYLEEMALWGFNGVAVWFDRHEFDGIDDPRAQAMLDRLTTIFRSVAGLGLKTVLMAIANEGYANSPVALRAECAAGINGYHTRPYGYYDVELCPAKPGALDLLLREFDELARRVAPTGIDYLTLWPYDQGGCTCERCAPWGANGFLRCAEPLARRFKQLSPDTKIIVSTWYFDRFVEGEWAAFDAALATPPDWADLLLAGDYGGLPFPEYPRRHGVPGGLPAIAFPEISMNGMYPWGGFGANTRPRELADMWAQAAPVVVGGLIYSEGIFEDLNKVVMARLFWDGGTNVDDIVADYISFELGASDVPAAASLVAAFEDTVVEARPPAADRPQGPVIVTITGPRQARTVAELAARTEESIPPRRRGAWRWRQLRLRADLQSQLCLPDPDRKRIHEALMELTTLYCNADGEPYLRPPYTAFA